MLSRTVVHNRMPTPSCRNLQECKSHGTVVKRGGTRDIDHREGRQPIKRADRHLKRLRALKLRTDKILTPCDRE